MAPKIHKLSFRLRSDINELKNLSQIYKPLRYLKILSISGVEIPLKTIEKIFKSKCLKGIKLIASDTKLTTDEALVLAK